MLISLNTTADMSADEARAKLGQVVYDKILKHPWYEKFVRPIPPDVVRFRIVDDGAFWRVECGSDGLRVVRFDVSKKIKRISAAHLFRYVEVGGKAVWQYVRSYDAEQNVKG